MSKDLRGKLKKIFQVCQKARESKAIFVKGLKLLYDKADSSEFFKELSRLLICILTVGEDEPAATNCFDIVAAFAVSLDTAYGDEDTMHEFLARLFDFLLRNQDVDNKTVRYQCCHLTNKLLEQMGDGAQIDESLYRNLYKGMIIRMKDKNAKIRVQAIHAISRLQEPSDRGCPVINGYLWLMRCDVNPDSRCAALECISATTKTLPSLLDRTRDCNDKVRQTAYRVISEKIHVRALTISQRVKLLENGLKDKSDAVCSIVSKILLQCWLRSFDGSVTGLLGCLDVDLATNTAELAVKALFGNDTASELVENFALLNENLVIDLNNLSREAIFYWRCLVVHVKQMGCFEEESLDKILPTGFVLAGYLLDVFQKFCVEKGDRLKQISDEFILRELLRILRCTNTVDQASMRRIREVLREILLSKEISWRLIGDLVECFSIVIDKSEEKVKEMLTVVSDLCQPLEEALVDGEGTRNQGELEERLETSIAELQKKIEELNMEKDDAEEEESLRNLLESKKKRLDEIKTLSVFDYTFSQKTSIEKIDSVTQLKVLSILLALLQDSKIKISSSINMALQEIVLPGMQSVEPAIRNQAVKCVGLIGILDFDIAKKCLPVLLQAMHVDTENIRASAVVSIIDILLVFGLKILEVEGNEEDVLAPGQKMEILATPSRGDDNSETAANVIYMITDLLNTTNGDIRFSAAEGLCKLLLHDRMSSSRLLSRLMILWFNPITEEEPMLRYMLSSFFLRYSFISFAHQSEIEKACIPAIMTIAEAPSSSPLYEVDVVALAELSVQLTDIKNLMMMKGISGAANPHHENLAFRIANLMLESPKSHKNKVWTHMLVYLSLPKSYDTLKSLHEILKKSSHFVTEPKCQKKLKIVIESIKKELPKCPEYEKDDARARSSLDCFLNRSVIDDIASINCLKDTYNTCAADKSLLIPTPSHQVKSGNSLTQESNASHDSDFQESSYKNNPLPKKMAVEKKGKAEKSSKNKAATTSQRTTCTSAKREKDATTNEECVVVSESDGSQDVVRRSNRNRKQRVHSEDDDFVSESSIKLRPLRGSHARNEKSKQPSKKSDLKKAKTGPSQKEKDSKKVAKDKVESKMTRKGSQASSEKISKLPSKKSDLKKEKTGQAQKEKNSKKMTEDRVESKKKCVAGSGKGNSNKRKKPTSASSCSDDDILYIAETPILDSSKSTSTSEIETPTPIREWNTVAGINKSNWEALMSAAETPEETTNSNSPILRKSKRNIRPPLSDIENEMSN